MASAAEVLRTGPVDVVLRIGSVAAPIGAAQITVGPDLDTNPPALMASQVAVQRRSSPRVGPAMKR